MENKDTIGKSILMVSLSLLNVWHLFRENGEEVKVELIGGEMRSHFKLSQSEKQMLNEHRKREAVGEKAFLRDKKIRRIANKISSTTFYWLT